MAGRKRTVVVFKFSANVPQFIMDAERLLSTITSERARQYIKITAKTKAQIKAHIKTLVQKQVIVNSGGRGAVFPRNRAMADVQNDIRELVRLVQKKADETEDEQQRLIMIEICGMKVKKPGGRTRQVFSAENDLEYGGVILRASSGGKRATHQWEYSTNKVNWITLPATWQATTKVMGLNPGAKCYFRHRLLTSDGEGNWEMTKAFRVVGFDEN